LEDFPVDPFTVEPAYEVSRRRGAGREVRSRPSGRWRYVALGLGLILAILVGATGSLLYSALNRGYGSSTGSASPTVGAGTASPSSTAHASDASGPTATPGGSLASPGVSTSPRQNSSANSGRPDLMMTILFP
jgi:hypothetical protein